MRNKREVEYYKSIGVEDSLWLHMEISYGCNIRCPMCTFHDEHVTPQVMSFNSLGNIHDGWELFSSVHIGDGSEPLINPEWDKIVSHIANHGPKVSIQTNAKKIRTLEYALRIVDSGLNLLSISVDGFTDGTMKKIRDGIGFSDIEKAVELVNKAKKIRGSRTPHLAANVVAMRSNLSELHDLLRFLNGSGFGRIRIGFLELRKPDNDLLNELLIYEKERARSIIKQLNDELSDATVYLDTGLFDDRDAQIKSKCELYKERIYVRQDGEMFACYGKRRIANMFQDGLESAIYSKDYKQFEAAVKVPGNDICASCTFCRNKSLDEVGDHFSATAIKHYTDDKIKRSVDYAISKGGIGDYWSDV
ncbi:MAG: radical SAM protein [Sedimenticola sp.]